MRRLVLGVIGHVDHGKTALVKALTGQDTDRLPEEKERGISITLGFAHLKINDAEIDLIDMPGHERFVRTMISGATGIDGVLLVVAANEGIKPQTVEHIEITALLGLHRAVVAITKTDLVSPEQARQVADDTMQLLAQSGLQSTPPILTSMARDKGIEELRNAIGCLAVEQRARPADGLAYLPIDRAFTIAGHGPVVTGTLRGASVSAGDTLELWPSQTLVRIRTVQVHRDKIETAVPSQRVALNLRDVEIGDLKRGMSLAAPGTLTLSDWLTISLRAIEGAPPLKNGIILRALLGTDEFDVRLRLLERDVLEGGEMGFAQLHCSKPVAVRAREHVILRLASPPRTVAGGKILDPETRRCKRHCDIIQRRLRDLDILPVADMIAAEIRFRGLAGTSLPHLARLSALSQTRIEDVLQTLPIVITASGLILWKAEFDELTSHIPALLARSAGGLSQNQLLAALPQTEASVLDEAVRQLVERGIVLRRGGQMTLRRPEEERARSQSEEVLANRIVETLKQTGLSPPTPKEIGTDAQTKRVVNRLVGNGVLVLAVDRAKRKEILFHRQAIEEARKRLAPLLAQGNGLRATEIGSALGISRKYTMPLLDHLDSIGFTRRVDDRRVPGRAFSSVR